MLKTIIASGALSLALIPALFAGNSGAVQANAVNAKSACCVSACCKACKNCEDCKTCGCKGGCCASK